MNFDEVLFCKNKRDAASTLRRLLEIHERENTRELVSMFNLGFSSCERIVGNKTSTSTKKYLLTKKRSARFSDSQKVEISKFITENEYVPDAGGKGEYLRSSDIYNQYIEFAYAPVSFVKFGIAMQMCGFKRKRTSTGWKYLIFKK